MRVHPFPFRTRKLSSPVPTILVWRRTGKIGQCQHRRPQSFDCCLLLYLPRFPRRCDTMALPWDFRHGRRKMQIRCNLLHTVDSYRQSIKMGGAGMDTFDVIFTTYSPFVFRYLRSLCGDAAVAEELTAETFYRAYTHFDSFRGDSKLETWLCAIAKNAYLKDSGAARARSARTRLSPCRRRLTSSSAFLTASRRGRSTATCTSWARSIRKCFCCARSAS